MYLDHRALKKINRILENVENKALLMDDAGSVLYPENDRRQLTLPEALLKNPYEVLVYGGVTLIGVRVEPAQKSECPLFLCLEGDNKDVRSCVRLCAELLASALKNDYSGTDVSQALRLILKGETDVSELESLAMAHNIPMDQSRFVMCIYSRTVSSETILKKLDELIDKENDICTDLSRSTVVLLKSLPQEHGFDDLKNEAVRIEEGLKESGVEALIGVSDTRRLISELPDALSEAREAINVGGIYRKEESLFLYRRLLLERFLNTVPKNTIIPYGTMVFNAQTARLFNDEMIHTIEVFFENNLNLSEAARKLYIHRNTLVYRLEKVQRLTGFDLREFDDAVTFKLMMLLSRNGNPTVNNNMI
ncbi:MAG: helix-turn-helix domain-containing protein [Clostridia bacterium]|nr:helix-turn-helix domain-containing protein [Clostridia bacterium]